MITLAIWCLLDCSHSPSADLHTQLAKVKLLHAKEEVHVAAGMLVSLRLPLTAIEAYAYKGLYFEAILLLNIKLESAEVDCRRSMQSIRPMLRYQLSVAPFRTKTISDHRAVRLAALPIA